MRAMPRKILPRRVIYAILCRAEGRVYVGRTNRRAQRWACHRTDLRKGNHYCALQAHWRVHGEQAFEFIVLEEVAEHEDIEARERHWISKLGAQRSRTGYSLNPGQLARLCPEQRMRAFSGAAKLHLDDAHQKDAGAFFDSSM